MTQPAELSRRLVEAFNRRDRDQMWRLLDPGVTYRIGGAPPIAGVPAVQAYYESVLASDIVATTVNIVEQGDTVMLENQYIGTIPDGRTFTIEHAVRHRWVNGLLVEYRNYNDPPLVDGEQTTFEHLLQLLGGR